jgi:maltooligosyltrehalose trehalohydrolase
MKRCHQMPFGAECRKDGMVRFRLWAPAAKQVSVWVADVQQPLPAVRGDFGWYELLTDKAKAGSLYRFRIDDGLEVPDPASRFQPRDVHGPSQVVDAAAFDWDDDGWRGRPWEEAVIYELHVGTFTPAGTFAAVQERLDHLVDIGITAIELMPVADFPGSRNWGYDGVLPYAPDSSYGTPDDLKRLVQAVHRKGLMIFLDVVYNHFGPDGNYLRAYSPEFFTNRHCTPWGDGINFDGEGSRVVRDFFIHNALYWLEEYHFDGLRLDAVHAILDDSSPHILNELATSVRSRFEGKREVHLVLENGNNSARYLQRDERLQPRGYDAQWDDDIHHALHVLLTGETDGYYSDYADHAICQLGRCLTEGFAFQGDFSELHQGKRGEPTTGLPPTAFVSFLQNHDQIGNRAFGDRILQVAPPQAVRVAMAILLLAPSPPLIFMGDEFGADTPFLFFCDFDGELAAAVTEGRRNEFVRFAKFSSPEIRSQIPNPGAEETYLRSKLNWRCLKEPLHASWLDFYRHLLKIRQKEIVPLLKNFVHSNFQVFGKSCLAVEWHFEDCLLDLKANLGNEAASEVPPSDGRVIYSTAGNDFQSKNGTMPAWSAVWSLRS